VEVLNQKKNNYNMKATDLRIGNYILYTGDDYGVVRVLEIREMQYGEFGNMSISHRGVNGGYCTTSLEEDDTGQSPEDFWIQPIPLTEEWLIKFGFDNSYGYGKYFIGHFMIRDEGDFLGWYILYLISIIIN
jgi:hypothetical protein